MIFQRELKLINKQENNPNMSFTKKNVPKDDFIFFPYLRLEIPIRRGSYLGLDLL